MRGFMEEDMDNDRESTATWDEEASQSPLMTGLIFMGLIVLSVIICALVWHFTHLNKPAGVKNNNQVVDILVDEKDTISEEETPPQEELPTEDVVTTMDGRSLVFIPCDDKITPKEYVNLRTEPSTSMGKETVSRQAPSGEILHRTAICEEAGWSRIEYDGEILYVVSSYIQEVE